MAEMKKGFVQLCHRNCRGVKDENCGVRRRGQGAEGRQKERTPRWI